MEDKIKCLHIISHMNDGGAQKVILNYAKDYSNDEDIEMSLLVLSKKTDHPNYQILENLGIKVFYIFPKKTNTKKINRLIELRFYKKAITKFLKNNDFNIVHVHLMGTLLFSHKALTRIKGILIFYTLHSDPNRFNGYKLRIIKRIFKNNNIIPICVTHEQESKARYHYGISKCETVHNGVDFEKIKNAIVTKEEARKLLRIEKDDYVICAVGRLDKVKRYDFLIKAFSEALKINNNCKLVIAGDGEEFKKLTELVISLNLKDRVFFLGNIDNVVILYCASDVLAITSESESASLVLLEAQACDVKCVISYGTPSESIITRKVVKMDNKTSDLDWAKELLKPLHFEEPNFSFNDYEVHLMSNKMKKIYLKYYSLVLRGELSKNDKYI